MGDDEFIARLNVELERPVPLVPLTAVVSRRNVSRRVAHVDVALRAGCASRSDPNLSPHTLGQQLDRRDHFETQLGCGRNLTPIEGEIPHRSR